MNARKLLDYCISKRYIVIILLIVFFPLGLYCMWKGEHFPKAARWVITVFMVWWGWNLLTDYESGDISSGCASVIESGGCTYYRDANCNIISKVCN